MNEINLKQVIAKNLSYYRRQAGWTQLELAERINYSDKSVSKWERAEGLPDIVVLTTLAELFGVTVNDLLTDPDALPEETTPMQMAMERVAEKALKRKANKSIILGLSSILVWFVALLIFVILSTLDIPKSWLAFFYAVPANAVVLLSLRSAWRDFRWNRALISTIMWGSIASIYATLLFLMNFNAWRIFLLGIPGQAAILLWFRMFRPIKNTEA